nr:CMRF35-like molecule 8 isoform X2 [Paramormyrops kingsleyae]
MKPKFLFSVFNGGLRFAHASKIKEVRGYVGGKVDIDCPYSADYLHYAKYWCRHPCNDVLVKSEKSDTYISKGGLSLYDNPNGLSFSVTINRLTLEDAGVYYCGIDKWWKDIYTEVHVKVSEASPASAVVPQTDPAMRLLTLPDRSMLVTQRQVTQLSTDPAAAIVINLQSVTVEKANHSTGHLSMGPATRLLTLPDRSMLVTQRHVTQLSTDPTATIVTNLQNVTAEKANHSTGHLSMDKLGSNTALLGSTFGLLMCFLLVSLAYLSKRLTSKSKVCFQLR